METIPIDTLTQLLNSKENDVKQTLFYAILIFFISTIVNLIIQIVLNRQNYKNDTSKIKIQKSLDIIKSIYEMLIDLKTNSISSPLNESFLQKIQAGNHALLKNRLNLTNGLIESGQNILDYFSEILTDFNKKDMKREKKLFDSFINEYGKI